MTYDEALAAMRQAFAADLRARRRDYRPRGLNWDQITAAEQEVFQIPPHEVPRLVTLHVYCMAFHKTHKHAEPFRVASTLPGSLAALIKPTAFMGSPAYKIIRRRLASKIDLKSGIAHLDTFLQLGALLGVPARLAHAWYHKDMFWQISDDFIVFDERAAIAVNDADDDEIPF
jgi:hypothetical protein